MEVAPFLDRRNVCANSYERRNSKIANQKNIYLSMKEIIFILQVTYFIISIVIRIIQIIKIKKNRQKLMAIHEFLLKTKRQMLRASVFSFGIGYSCSIYII